LHARIVDAMQRLYADRLDEHVERLAQHAFRGQLWQKAISYSRAASERAFGRSAAREAIEHLEQALAALEQLPRTPHTIEQIIDVRFDLRTILLGINEHVRSYEHLEQAEALARELGDERRIAWVAAYQAHHLRATVDHQRGVAAGEIAIATARALGDVRLQAEATGAVAMSYHEMGQLPRAIELLR